MRTHARVSSLLVLAAALAGAVHGQVRRTVSFRGGPTILIDVPMGYSFGGRVNADDSVRVVLENPVWGIKITALMAREPDPAATSRAWQENKLIGFIGDALAISRERDYAFRSLDPEWGTGIYCTLTADGAAAAGGAPGREGSYLTAGLKTLPGCVVIFIFPSRDLRSEEYQEAFNLFRTSFAPQ